MQKQMECQSDERFDISGLVYRHLLIYDDVFFGDISDNELGVKGSLSASDNFWLHPKVPSFGILN
jgi:hypothetical protein